MIRVVNRLPIGKNVKICASHAGLTLGEDGTHHIFGRYRNDENAPGYDGCFRVTIARQKPLHLLLPIIPVPYTGFGVLVGRSY